VGLIPTGDKAEAGGSSLLLDPPKIEPRKGEKAKTRNHPGGTLRTKAMGAVRRVGFTQAPPGRTTQLCYFCGVPGPQSPTRQRTLNNQNMAASNAPSINT